MNIFNNDGSISTSQQALGSLTVANSSCNSAFVPKLKTQLLRSNIVIPKPKTLYTSANQPQKTKENNKNEKIKLHGQNAKPSSDRRCSSQSPIRRSRIGSTKLMTPLTVERVTLFNKMVPPLKGDYRTIVRTWLQKSIP